MFVLKLKPTNMKLFEKLSLILFLCAASINLTSAQSSFIDGTNEIKEKNFTLGVGLNSMDCNLHTTTYGAYLSGEYNYQKLTGNLTNNYPAGLKVGGNAKISFFTGSEAEEKYGRSYTGLYANIGGDIGYSIKIKNTVFQPSVGPQLVLPLAVKKEGVDAGDIDAGYGIEGKLKVFINDGLALETALTRFSNDLDPYGDINEYSDYQVTYNFSIGITKVINSKKY